MGNIHMVDCDSTDRLADWLASYDEDKTAAAMGGAADTLDTLLQWLGAADTLVDTLLWLGPTAYIYIYCDEHSPAASLIKGRFEGSQYLLFDGATCWVCWQIGWMWWNDDWVTLFTSCIMEQAWSLSECRIESTGGNRQRNIAGFMRLGAYDEWILIKMK